MPTELDGSVVLITGANGALGTSVTQTFLNAGAQVIGVSPSIKDSDFPHPHFTAISAAIEGRQDAQKIAAQVLGKFGRIDGLVHLVGGYSGGRSVEESVADSNDDVLERMLNMNLKAAFYMIGAVLPAMRQQGSGRIAAMGSKVALEPTPHAAAYAASKAALVSLIRSVARENADRNIAANIILPGTIDTPANRAAMPTANFAKWTPPARIAHLLAKLIGDADALLNGVVIPVD